VADAFHQAAIAQENPGAVVDEVEAGAVVALRQQLLGQRHADRVGQPLAERPGGGLDAKGMARFRDGRRSGLPSWRKRLQFIERQVVAAQVQQA
jgi:hypothetical protein